MAHTECCEPARVSESLKVPRSPDWSLQLDSMKSESLVIAYQNDAVNTFPGLVHTARHTMEADCSRSRYANLREAAVQGVVDDWGEVVTRYPYRKVWMDHLLSKEFSKGQTFETLRSIARTSRYLLFGFERPELIAQVFPTQPF